MSRQAIKDFGGYPKDSDEVLSRGTKVSRMEKFNGYDGSGEYPDTSKDILTQQKKTVDTYKRQKMKEGFRN
jgi:hypothetical protein